VNPERLTSAAGARGKRPEIGEVEVGPAGSVEVPAARGEELDHRAPEEAGPPEDEHAPAHGIPWLKSRSFPIPRRSIANRNSFRAKAV